MPKESCPVWCKSLRCKTNQLLQENRFGYSWSSDQNQAWNIKTPSTCDSKRSECKYNFSMRLFFIWCSYTGFLNLWFCVSALIVLIILWTYMFLLSIIYLYNCVSVIFYKWFSSEEVNSSSSTRKDFLKWATWPQTDIKTLPWSSRERRRDLRQKYIMEKC